MIPRVLAGCAIALALPAFAQLASAPGEAIVPPGIPPDERVDVTGDGIADLVITGRTDHLPDPERGLEGWYRRLVRTLPGTAILVRGSANDYSYYLLAEGASLDTAALAKGFHFKQLQWAQSEPTEFHVLEQPFGPGITPAQKGWYFNGEQYEGSFVLRSTLVDRAAIAAFRIVFNIPAGRIWLEPFGSMPVHARFGDPAPAPLPLPASRDEPPKVDFSFGHEVEPQVIIPPGIPPDVQLDIAADDAFDVVLTGREVRSPGTGGAGYFVRGLSPLPGMAFLMQRETTDHPWTFFRLAFQAQLTPEHLGMGLQHGTLRWASPEHEPVFFPVLQHPFGMADRRQEWSLVEEQWAGDLVYRTSYYGRETIIGVIEVQWRVPGGELRLQPQTWVEEGKVLQVR